MENKVQSILDKLDKESITCINYDYYFKGSKMVEDSFEYSDEFDTLYIVWQDKKAHDFSRGLNCLIKPHIPSATLASTFSFDLQYTF